MTAAILVLCLFLAVAHEYNAVHGTQRFTKLNFASTGSEALVFDPNNGGPYTGLNDGRIVQFHGPEIGFLDFATTSPNRTSELCDGTSDLRTALPCGKPLGMEFNHATGELYVIDGFRGLFVVGKEGGLARLLSGGEKVHYDYADAIDIDQSSGVVYIVDIGSILLKNNNMTDILLKGSDRSGRLLKYDPRTKETTVLETELAMPAGVAISSDGSFLVISEYLTRKLTRYWLTGPKANTLEKFLDLPGNPDNIKRTSSGDFWAAVNIQKLQPKLTVTPLAQKISANGVILETVNLNGEYNATYVTEVQEHGGKYYVASINTGFVGVYDKLGC